jgi:hypothetical protein
MPSFLWSTTSFAVSPTATSGASAWIIRISFDRERDLDLVALDEALKELTTLDTRQSRIVELLFLEDSPSKRLPKCSAFRPPPSNVSGAPQRRGCTAR